MDERAVGARGDARPVIGRLYSTPPRRLSSAELCTQRLLLPPGVPINRNERAGRTRRLVLVLALFAAAAVWRWL